MFLVGRPVNILAKARKWETMFPIVIAANLGHSSAAHSPISLISDNSRPSIFIYKHASRLGIICIIITA